MSFGFVCLLIVFLFLFLLLFRQVRIIHLMRRSDNRTISVAVTTYIFILSMLKTIILLYHGRLGFLRLVHSDRSARPFSFPFSFSTPLPLPAICFCTVIPREVFFVC